MSLAVYRGSIRPDLTDICGIAVPAEGFDDERSPYFGLLRFQVSPVVNERLKLEGGVAFVLSRDVEFVTPVQQGDAAKSPKRKMRARMKRDPDRQVQVKPAARLERGRAGGSETPEKQPAAAHSPLHATMAGDSIEPASTPAQPKERANGAGKPADKPWGWRRKLMQKSRARAGKVPVRPPVGQPQAAESAVEARTPRQSWMQARKTASAKPWARRKRR